MKEKAKSQIRSEDISSLPKRPGVYLMKSEVGAVLYIGKAKDLRARVRSYFSGTETRINIPFLMEQVFVVDTLVTEDERQAIILESDLIKKYKPKYNVRLKDDKAYLHVRIDMNQAWPKLDLVRRVEDDGARYFGPYAFSYELRAVLEVINRTIPLRTCSNRVMQNRVRPCLEYQIKRCAGPCCLGVDEAQYGEWIEEAISILEGKNAELILQLEEKMGRASAEQRYEDAALYRDRIEILKKVSEEKATPQFGSGAFDAFGFYREETRVELSLLMVRRGRLFEGKTFGFSEAHMPDEEVLSSLLTQYYESGAELPDEILLPFGLEDSAVREDLYSEKKGSEVQIFVPRRGQKKRQLELAEQNAYENFVSRFETPEKGDKKLRALQAELGLSEVPRTLECIDISHFQGGQTVGGVVSFRDGHPDKSRYRIFHLSQEGKPDDFASMREVALRHLSRGVEENTLPDLIVVDGGPAQLSQVLKIRAELGLGDSPALIGLAKKRAAKTPYRFARRGEEGEEAPKPERVYLENEPLPVILKPSSEALHLLERIRDEAHRFAISSHRRARSKQAFQSELDRIPGVGPKRRRALLREFGSVRVLREATPEELVERVGLPLALAERIVEMLSTPPST